MKIVCESCGAKYSIADERVTGKVFKIRCKRCSEVIIVRGDQPSQPAAEAPQGASLDQGAIWHVVVEGEQAGPYTPSQLAEMLAAGTVDWEAYVWTEGFDNWLPMRDVPDLVAQITGQGAAQQQPAAQSRAAAYRSTVNQTLTGQPSMGADPFADDAPADGGLFSGGAAAAAAGPDLFARSPAHAGTSPFAAGPDSGLVTSAVGPRVDAAQAMTGARNENSVLFSLKNLQALATGSGTSLPPATTTAGGGGVRDGYAGGEGSGLIDIRALATATGVNESGEGSGTRDELLSIGSQGGAFGTLGSPMLAPVGDDGDGNKKVLVWAAVAMVGFLSAAAVAIIYIMRAPTPPSGQPIAVAPASPVSAVAAAQAPSALPAAAPQPLSEGALAAAKAAQEGKADEASSSRPSERGGRRRSSGSSDGPKPSETSAPALPAEKREAPPRPGGPKSIDELLDGALSGSSSAKAKTAEVDPGRANLPEIPSRDQVKSAMDSVKSAVSGCAQGQGGIAMVTVSVAGESGRVTNAQVSGVTGPAGSCVAQAVRRAQFPKFQNKVFKVQYPFKL
jgi:predicted Zn finger-like uncharacterized protein